MNLGKPVYKDKVSGVSARLRGLHLGVSPQPNNLNIVTSTYATWITDWVAFSSLLPWSHPMFW